MHCVFELNSLFLQPNVKKTEYTYQIDSNIPYYRKGIINLSYIIFMIIQEKYICIPLEL